VLGYRSALGGKKRRYILGEKATLRNEKGDSSVKEHRGKESLLGEAGL